MLFHEFLLLHYVDIQKKIKLLIKKYSFFHMLKFLNKSNLKKINYIIKFSFYHEINYFTLNLGLIDTFQNRINLIFLHISFLFIKLKQNDKNQFYKEFFQKMFDLIFNKIELNMREIGYGDMTINKNMKFLVKIFYNILLNCENYKKKNIKKQKFVFT